MEKLNGSLKHGYGHIDSDGFAWSFEGSRLRIPGGIARIRLHNQEETWSCTVGYYPANQGSTWFQASSSCPDWAREKLVDRASKKYGVKFPIERENEQKSREEAEAAAKTAKENAEKARRSALKEIQRRVSDLKGSEVRIRLKDKDIRGILCELYSPFGDLDMISIDGRWIITSDILSIDPGEKLGS